MRYDKRVTLVLNQKQDEHYDCELGMMVGSKFTKKIVACHVSNQGLQTQSTFTDKLILDAKIIRFKEVFHNIDHILLDGRKYKVSMSRIINDSEMAIYANEVL